MFKHTFQKEAYLHIKQVLNCIFCFFHPWSGESLFPYYFERKQTKEKSTKEFFFMELSFIMT